MAPVKSAWSEKPSPLASGRTWGNYLFSAFSSSSIFAELSSYLSSSLTPYAGFTYEVLLAVGGVLS